MLEPHQRQLLLDALHPPPGLSFDRAVGTSFSLNLHSVLTVPLALALLDLQGGDEARVDSTSILEAVRRTASNLDVFCQAGQIALPEEYRPLLAYVEPTIHEASAPTPGRVFHPKLWIIRFRSQAGEPEYRVLCLSRNLTSDRSWDTILRLDGAPTRRSKALSARNRPLSRFVATLPTLAPVPADRAREIRRLAGELLSVEFEPPDEFYDIRFWPLGIRGFRGWPFADDGWGHSRLLVVSPFVSPGVLQRLNAPGIDDVLVSRSETLDGLSEADLNSFENVFVLSAGAEGDDQSHGEYSKEDEELAERPDVPLTGLHAKVFVSEFHHMARVWTGSANATNAAFGGNVEFMVELQGSRSACGVDAVLNGEGGSVGLGEFLSSYQPPDVPTVESAEHRLERRLDEIRRELARCGFKALVENRSRGDAEPELFDLSLRLDHDVTRLPRGVHARIWPITLGPDVARPLRSSRQAVRFRGLSFVAITAFFAIELEASSAEARASMRFVVTARLEGAPKNRYDRLLTTILRDRSDVLRYLLLLLAGDDFASSAAPTRSVGASLGETWSSSVELPLFESMVRALSRDPTRLDHVERLIRSLRASDEGRQLLPEDEQLEAVWGPIWTARQGLSA